MLDHYLEVLVRKPGALAVATALSAARAAGSFTPAHQAFWDAARRALADQDGTRALVGALLLHRTLPAAALAHAMAEAVSTGRFDADLLAVTARAHLAAQCPALNRFPRPTAQPVQATPRQPTPSLAGSDQLLSRPPMEASA